MHQQSIQLVEIDFEELKSNNERLDYSYRELIHN